MKNKTIEKSQPVEQQVFNYIKKALVRMKVTATAIEEEADFFFDLNLNIDHVDRLFNSVENKFHLNSTLMFSPEVATLKGLSHYVGHQVKAA